MPDAGEDLVRSLVGFGQQLRAAGVVVGTGDIQSCCSAVAPLNPADLGDLFWAGRITLVHRHEDLPVYDRVFREYFLGIHAETAPDPIPLARRPVNDWQADVEVPMVDQPGSQEREEERAEMGLVGSDVEVLRGKAFADCTEDELRELRRIMRTMRLVPPRRRTRRSTPVRRGHRVDLRRTVRETLRRHGEPPPLRRRTLRLRPRRLVLLLDVSGSMADYSRNLLQFAHSTRRAVDRTEVFCFGTRLARITSALDHRGADEALSRAARSVFDWEGGTRIGVCLDRFVRDWGRRGLSRGAIVVICSDGLDRGDPALLATALERLTRLSHAIVWLNPHVRNTATNLPRSLGMMVAEPYLDLVLSGHDLAGLFDFAAALPALG